jgi:glutamate receptor, ionotropic, invertebrate
LIEKLADILGFEFEFKLQEDKNYGKYDNETGEWNGMLGELNKSRADLAVTDLTITAERESAFDFTSPFMTLGISILYEKPKAEDPDLTSFLKPFSYGVWSCLLGCFILVAISLFVMGRMSPQEWFNPYQCIEKPTVMHNLLTLKNCIWFTIGVMFMEGTEIAPRAISTRLVASLWMLMTLIVMNAFYTAKLASFLTIEKPFSLVNDVNDLINPKPGVNFGAKATGSTLLFFRDSKNKKFNAMFDKMIADPNLPVGNNEGLELAKKGKYAFLMESATIEFMIERNCEVVQVGRPLDEKGYGVAMKKCKRFVIVIRVKLLLKGSLEKPTVVH